MTTCPTSSSADAAPTYTIGSGNRTHLLDAAGRTVCGAGNSRFGPPVLGARHDDGGPPTCTRCRSFLAPTKPAGYGSDRHDPDTCRVCATIPAYLVNRHR